MNDIYNALETQQLCAAIFIDLAKAFDTVDHSILLSRLHSIGVSNSTLSWFSNYLFNRFQYVKIDQQLSVPLTINKGVPQGSVLASTLFSIYINNISQVICSQKTYIHLYADDTILYVVGSSYDEVLKQAQDSFNKIQEAFNDLKLVLNSTKTKVMWFGKKIIIIKTL